MAEKESGYFPLTLRRGETRPIVLTYRPKDKTLPPYVITGQPIEMRIQADGVAEIVYGGPQISITNGPQGEFTIAIPGATVAAYSFGNADYVVMLNGKRLLFGPLTIEGLYD